MNLARRSGRNVPRFARGALWLSLLLGAGAFGQRGPVPGFNGTTPYLVYYGTWDAARIDFARTHYQMVVLHPQSRITAAQVAALKRGPDDVAGTADDVLVLAYISLGEDARPGAPLVGDGRGPRVDPRTSDSEPLSSITNALGLPSPGGTGYASYYLDTKANPDGIPDRNSIYGGCYVNGGDPAWWTELKTMVRASGGWSGLDEILTPTYGAGLNCDGLFLDTVDVCAPNSFGGTTYEWTTPGMQGLVRQISTNCPSKLLMANRGLFFYNPNLKHYAYTIRPYVNMVMFESYFTDSNNSSQITPSFADNKYDYAPKLNAEAGRPDGFTVVALGYDHTPPLPQWVIDQDYVESMGIQGWPLYRTNPQLDTPFSTNAVAWSAAHLDTAPPEWDSTAASSGVAPAPRIGAQEVVPGTNSVIVRWDVARDQTGPVRYNLYYTAEPTLNFNTATKLPAVIPSLPTAYLSGAGAGRYPYEYTVTNLTPGLTYLFAVRAEDSATPSHEDTNTVVLAAVVGAASGMGTFRHVAVDGDFSDWAGVPVLATNAVVASPVSFATLAAANDDDYLYLRFTLHAPAVPFADYNTHVFIDTDATASTGYPPTGTAIGSELVVESGQGYDERGGVFAGAKIGVLGWALAPAGTGTNFEARIWRLARYADGSPVFNRPSIRLVLQDNRGSVLTPQGVAYSFAPGGPYQEWRAKYFTSAELANPAISGDGADASGDGIANLVKFAFNLNPRVLNHPTLPRAFVAAVDGQTYLHLEFIRRNPPADVQYAPQISTDLVTWADAALTPVSALDQGDGTSRVTLRLNGPVQSTGWTYLRVAIFR